MDRNNILHLNMNIPATILALSIGLFSITGSANAQTPIYACGGESCTAETEEVCGSQYDALGNLCYWDTDHCRVPDEGKNCEDATLSECLLGIQNGSSCFLEGGDASEAIEDQSENMATMGIIGLLGLGIIVGIIIVRT